MSQPLGFWGIVLEPEKLYSQQVPVSFKITMASLGPEAKYKEGESNRNTVMLVHQKDGEFALCSLTPEKVEQQPLDLVLRQGDTIHLRVEGQSAVHLVGYYVDLADEEDEEEEGCSEYSEGESINSANMLSEEEGDSELDEYETEDSDEDEESESAEVSEEERKPRRPKICLVDSEEEEEDSDEDEEIDSDEFGTSADDSEEDSEESEVEEVPRKKRMAPEPAATVEASSKKAKLITPQATPKASKTASPQQQQASPKATPQPVAKEAKKEQEVKASPSPNAEQKQKENAKPVAAPQLVSKALPNGVQVQDLSLGEGIKAQKGRKVELTVSLASEDGKSLGKQQSMSFVCGANEQAKGLDAGIIGMALGGERKVTIPAGLMKEGPVVATVKLNKVVNTK